MWFCTAVGILNTVYYCLSLCICTAGFCWLNAESLCYQMLLTHRFSNPTQWLQVKKEFTTLLVELAFHANTESYSSISTISILNYLKASENESNNNLFYLLKQLKGLSIHTYKIKPKFWYKCTEFLLHYSYHSKCLNSGKCARVPPHLCRSLLWFFKWKILQGKEEQTDRQTTSELTAHS